MTKLDLEAVREYLEWVNSNPNEESGDRQELLFASIGVSRAARACIDLLLGDCYRALWEDALRLLFSCALVDRKAMVALEAEVIAAAHVAVECTSSDESIDHAAWSITCSLKDLPLDTDWEPESDAQIACVMDAIRAHKRAAAARRNE